jgi:hypothetical protein
MLNVFYSKQIADGICKIEIMGNTKYSTIFCNTLNRFCIFTIQAMKLDYYIQSTHKLS